MKKLLLIFLAVSLLISSLVGCGTYDGVGGGSVEIPSGDTQRPPLEGDPSEYFTVKIIYDGEIFKNTDGVEAQWSSKTSVYRASFDSDNIARISGLDGEYSVTLYGLPSGYSYDTNVNIASNTKRNIEIEIFQEISTNGTGTNMYSPIEVFRLGIYTAKVKLETGNNPSTVHYEFKPTRAGTYIIETICDVTENVINPQIDVYSGTFANKNYSHTVNTGGSFAEYTRNARYTVAVDAQNIGASYSFAITATHKKADYPINVNFVIRYAGEYTNPSYYMPFEIIIPDQAALAERGMIQNPTGTLKYPEIKISDGVYVFDEKYYKFNPDDGFYHIYDPDTDTLGPVLYAKITRRHRFFADYQGSEVSFAGGPSSICVEDPGNKSLQVLGDNPDCFENYKLFIQGAAKCQSVVGMEGCVGLGYANYIPSSNTEGVYPVTEELKEFLLKFSISQRYFNDGNGWAETTAEDELGYRIYSSEEAQWLFACCYYV